MGTLGENLAPFLVSEVHTIEMGGAPIITRRVAGSGIGLEKTPIPPVEQTSFICIFLAPNRRQSLFKLGKLYNDQPYPESAIEIMHLGEEPEAITPVEFDCFHLEIPDASMHAFAQAQHRREPGLLRCGKNTIDPTMRHLAEALLPLLSHPQEQLKNAERLYFEQITLAMLAHLSDHYGAPVGRSQTAGRLTPWQQRLVAECMTADLRDEPSLEVLARLCDLPIMRFIGDFRRTTGFTPARYMRQIRIEAAKEMLFHTALPLKDIAYRCGFADHSHFTRVFAAHVGMTPAAWRRER